jgi:DNA-binding Lrp family transcriptional regulator
MLSIKAIKEVPEVEQCHMIASNFDYLVKVRTENMESYRQVLGEKNFCTTPLFKIALLLL